MTLLHTPEDIFDEAYGYIFIILCGMVTTIFYNMCAAFLRALGNSKTPLYFLIISCILNLGLDLLFIMACSMGVIGAALATVIAQAVSGVLCWLYIRRKYKAFLPENAEYKPDGKLYKEMLTTGFSMALMLSVFSIGSIVLQGSINDLGTDIIGAHTSSRRIIEMFMMPLSLVLRTAIQSMGRKIIPVVSSSIELLFKVLSCMFVIPQLSYLGVVITEPIIWVTCAVFLCIVYLIQNRKKETAHDF